MKKNSYINEFFISGQLDARSKVLNFLCALDSSTRKIIGPK